MSIVSCVRVCGVTIAAATTKAVVVVNKRKFSFSLPVITYKYTFPYMFQVHTNTHTDSNTALFDMFTIVTYLLQLRITFTQIHT